MSAYVRRTATACIVKTYQVDSDQFVALRDMILRLLTDRDVSVVSSAVLAFHSLCVANPPQSEDPVELLRLLDPHYRRLVASLLSMDTWAQCYAIDVLLRYAKAFFKRTEDEEDAMN